MNAVVVVVAATLLVSCGMEHPPPQITEWHGIEGRSFPGAPYLVAGGELILDDLPARLTLVTWPELEEVPSDVTQGPDPRGGARTVVWVSPAAPLADRWYAIRWSGETHPHTTLDGVPLADGSWVWRLHGTYVPELTELAYSAGAVYAFGVDDLAAVVPACPMPGPAVIVSQDAESWVVDCGVSSVGFSLATPGLDAERPCRFRVLAGGLETNDGLPFEVVDVVIDRLGAGLVDLPPARNPPLVPSALCAGVACE